MPNDGSTPDFMDVFTALPLPSWILTLPVTTEKRFHVRQWRLDFAWPTIKAAVEVQGGFYRGASGHSSVTGIRRDQEKCNAAQIEGWLVLYIETTKLKVKKRLPELARLIQQGFEVARKRTLLIRKAQHGCNQLNSCDRCETGLF